MTAVNSYAIHNIIKNDNDYIKINYEDLTINPKKYKTLLSRLNNFSKVFFN